MQTQFSNQNNGKQQNGSQESGTSDSESSSDSSSEDSDQEIRPKVVLRSGAGIKPLAKTNSKPSTPTTAKVT